jgi:hypothetical protein
MADSLKQAWYISNKQHQELANILSGGEGGWGGCNIFLKKKNKISVFLASFCTKTIF